MLLALTSQDGIIDCTTDWAAYIDGDVRRMLMTTLAPLSRQWFIVARPWNSTAGTKKLT